MDFKQIRRTVIVALFSDEVLTEKLLLKGGNAISLAHGIADRASLDIDFSMKDDFEDIDEIKTRIFAVLENAFASLDQVVFDREMHPKPLSSTESRWGGYVVLFKLINKHAAEQLGDSPSALRRNASVVGRTAQDSTNFKIEISKYEYCDQWQEKEMDGTTIRVYTPAMIVIEKLRAICQQMESYPLRKNPTPRPRDFFDIHALLSSFPIDLSTEENLHLTNCIFEVKDVPMALLAELSDTRSFHKQAWTSVVQTVVGNIEAYDYYFDYVLRAIRPLTIKHSK